MRGLRVETLGSRLEGRSLQEHQWRGAFLRGKLKLVGSTGCKTSHLENRSDLIIMSVLLCTVTIEGHIIPRIIASLFESLIVVVLIEGHFLL